MYKMWYNAKMSEKYTHLETMNLSNKYNVIVDYLAINDRFSIRIIHNFILNYLINYYRPAQLYSDDTFNVSSTGSIKLHVIRFRTSKNKLLLCTILTSTADQYYFKDLYQ